MGKRDVLGKEKVEKSMCRKNIAELYNEVNTLQRHLVKYLCRRDAEQMILAFSKIEEIKKKIRKMLDECEKRA